MMSDRKTELLPGVLVFGSAFNALGTEAFRS